MAKRIQARLTAREGRRFALTLAVAFGALGGLTMWRGHDIASLVFLILAGAFVAAGLLVAAHLSPVYNGWMRMAVAISKVTTPIFMGILYYGIITPVGLLRRGLGSNPLKHRPTNEAGYWHVSDPDSTRSDLKRQF